MSVRNKCKHKNEQWKAGPSQPIFVAGKTTKVFSERCLFGGNEMAWQVKQPVHRSDDPHGGVVLCPPHPGRDTLTPTVSTHI